MGALVFQNPLLALGAFAASLPILIHLLQRRRPRPVPFPAIELVRRSQRKNVRSLRLKRLLLLLARVLLLLLLPLALGRPRFASEASAAAAPRGPTATALVLDASMSMNHVLDGRSLFSRAQKDARAALAALSPEEPVSVVLCDGRPPVASPPSFDRGAARGLLDDALPTLRAADLSTCLSAAALALGESPLPGKRIVIFSDLQASALRVDAPPPVVQTPQGEVRPELTFVDAADGAALSNAAVTELRTGPAPALGPRGRTIDFTARSFGGEALADHAAELHVGEEIEALTLLQLPPGGAATKELQHRFPRGGAFGGRIVLTHDGLVADDTRAFVARVPRDLRALVVNGGPSSQRIRDEAFFVEAALKMRGASPIALTTVDPETFATTDLAAFDLVFLLNVRASDKLARLQPFVEQGGGLFVSLGDSIEADAFNAAMGPLLPRPLHLPKQAGERGREDLPPARIVSIDVTHPVLQVFTGVGREGLTATRTYRYFLLQPGRDDDGAKVLASFDDGAPAFVEKQLGLGRVLLFTSTVDRDWSDWPIQTSFLPALQQAAAHLSRSLEAVPPPDAVVGAAYPIVLPAGATLAEVIAPDGQPRAVQRRSDAPPLLAEIDVPGVWLPRGRFAGETSDRELWELAFAAHVDPRESDPTRLQPAELAAMAGGAKVEIATESADRTTQTPLYSVLLLLGVLAFLAEGFLVRR